MDPSAPSVSRTKQCAMKILALIHLFQLSVASYIHLSDLLRNASIYGPCYTEIESSSAPSSSSSFLATRTALSTFNLFPTGPALKLPILQWDNATNTTNTTHEHGPSVSQVSVSTGAASQTYQSWIKLWTEFILLSILLLELQAR
jgi:hypothetical protein